jgi:hypothetical protein
MQESAELLATTPLSVLQNLSLPEFQLRKKNL